MSHHDLKSQDPYFDAVRSGEKTFEIRYDDRGFQKGDTVRLKQYDGSFYRHEDFWIEVTYVTAFKQQSGWGVFGFKKLSQKRVREIEASQ